MVGKSSCPRLSSKYMEDYEDFYHEAIPLKQCPRQKVLTKWQSLKMAPHECTQKYVDMFWELHLKATIYKQKYFSEQKQQFCAGLPKEISENVNSQRPKTTSMVIHHMMVTARINFQQGSKKNSKPWEAKDQNEQNSFNAHSNNNKAKMK